MKFWVKNIRENPIISYACDETINNFPFTTIKSSAKKSQVVNFLNLSQKKFSEFTPSPGSGKL